MRTILAILSAAFLASPALAGDCGKAHLVLEGLSSRYGEHEAFDANVNGKQVVVTVSPSGSFTILAAPAPGVLCMLFAGEGWAVAAPKAPVPDAIPQMYRLPNGKGGYRYFYPVSLR